MDSPEDLNNAPNPQGSEPSGNRPSDELPPPPVVLLASSEAGEPPVIEITPRECFENWLANNVPPLLVMCLSLSVLMGVMIAAPLVIPKHAPIEPKPPTAPLNEMPADFNVLRVGLMGLILFTMILTAAPQARQWLFRFPRRAMPALHGLDLVAVLAVFFAALNAISLIAYAVRPFVHGASGLKTVAHLLINDSAMCCSFICAILLARVRSRATHGSAGIWPFWTLIDKDRPMWKDIALGVGCYPLVYMLLGTLVVPLSQMVLKALHKPLDQNPIIDEILPVQGGWQLMVVVMTVSLGAGFFEELFFRGMLYNVMRRYLGALAGAIAAALVFAALHQTLTEAMALFVLAMVLTWLYERTGRLVASMTLHAVNNGVALLGLWYIHSGAGKH